jgi:ABC-2 type transport system permease protein
VDGRDLLTHLRKESYWARRRVPALLLLVVVLPAVFAVGTVAFESVVPQDTPVAVVPASEAVTEDDLTVATGVLGQATDPRRVDSAERARTLLSRERVYAVVTVPANLTADVTDPATVEYRVAGTVVPYRKPSQAIAAQVEAGLDGLLARPVTVTHVEQAPTVGLREYLAPAALVLLAVLVGLGFLPRLVSDERQALPRLRVESSLAAVLAAKVVAGVALMLVPFGTVAAVVTGLSYDLHPVNPTAVLAYLLLVVHVAALGMTVALVLEERAATVLNLGLVIALLLAGNPVYPRGFFSVVRGQVADLVPLHHAAVALRAGVLRDATPAAVSAELGVVAAAALGTLLALSLTARLFTGVSR